MEIRELLLKARHQTGDAPVYLGAPTNSLSKQLRLQRPAKKCVPHVLTEDQKQSLLNPFKVLKE